jgi:hypothetical protein
MNSTNEETKNIFKKDKLENQKNKEGYTIERSTPSVFLKISH